MSLDILPKIDNSENTYSKIPFNKGYVKKVLIEYLFNGKNTIEIDQEFFNNGLSNTGSLASKVIEYYKLKVPSSADHNLGIYKGQDVRTIAIELKNNPEIEYKNIGAALLDDEEDSPFVINYSNKDRITGGSNLIYYGVPGCGKSYQVTKDFPSNDFSIHRTTFQPEYSNTDFVGQIIPEINNGVLSYRFHAGPFTNALMDAVSNPQKKVCLIIEELNRGNAPGIFGDIFQILDRDNDGESIYPIENDAITSYFKSLGIDGFDRISLPSNLWIVATMNTSDQNVFTLDTAFKRRWAMRYVENIFTDGDIIADYYVPMSTVTWKEFIDKINNKIVETGTAGMNSEDKQIGTHFVTKNELSAESDNGDLGIKKAFAQKVLSYLWDDVAGEAPEIWFDDCKTFDALYHKYLNSGLSIFGNMFEKDQNENEER